MSYTVKINRCCYTSLFKMLCDFFDKNSSFSSSMQFDAVSTICIILNHQERLDKPFAYGWSKRPNFSGNLLMLQITCTCEILHSSTVQGLKRTYLLVRIHRIYQKGLSLHILIATLCRKNRNNKRFPMLKQAYFWYF